jgi:hypothetical protein
MKPWFIFVIGLVMLCTACVVRSETTPGATIRPAATDTPVPETDAPAGIAPTRPVKGPVIESGKPGPIPAGALLVYRRSGGFAGIDQTWTLFTDGRMDLPGGRNRSVSAGEAQALVDGLEQMGFFRLDESYGRLGACCDHYTYQLTLVKNGQARTITYIDSAELPTVLGQMQGRVEAFFK